MFDRTTHALSARAAPLAALGFVLPHVAAAQLFEMPSELAGLSPGEIAAAVIETSVEKDLARKAGVDRYLVVAETGMASMPMTGVPPSTLLYEKVRCSGDTGVAAGFRIVPPGELQQRVAGLDLTSTELAGIAGALGRLSTEINPMLAEGGVPVGMVSAFGAPLEDQMGVNPLDPGSLVGAYATLLGGAAQATAESERARSTDGPVCRAAARIGSGGDALTYVGQEAIDDSEAGVTRNAYVLEAGGLGMVQQVDPRTTMTIDTATLWIDAEQHVPLQMRFAATAEQDGESKPVTIERRQTDWRGVAGADSMFESHRQVMSIGGWADMGPEAAEAQAQLAELEEQLANAPANQRAMIERMLGPQLEMIRGMAEGGAIEIETTVRNIMPNPPIPPLPGP